MADYVFTDTLTVDFTATAVFKVDSWNWDFGDGTTSHEQNPVHVFPASGIYFVTLVVRCGDFYRTITADVQVTGDVACTSEDPLPTSPDFTDLSHSINVTAINQYGLLGFEEQRDWNLDSSELNWTICPNNDYSDGPEVEGKSANLNARFLTRWRVTFDYVSNTLSYGRFGFAEDPAPSDLIPTPVLYPKRTQVSLCFDADAKPCFAIQVDPTTIEIHRYVHDEPFVYSWTGVSPRLFFDGTLQRSSALWDVVCFYVNDSGEICARFQRDLFRVEFVLYSPAIPAQRITKTDRIQSWQFLYYINTAGERKALRSHVYPPWPIYEVDVAKVSGVSGQHNAYDQVVTFGGYYTDYSLLTVGPGISNDYPQVTIFAGFYLDIGVIWAGPGQSNLYLLISVDGGQYQDAAAVSSRPGSGLYVLTTFYGGSYLDKTRCSTLPGTSNSYTLV